MAFAVIAMSGKAPPCFPRRIFVDAFAAAGAARLADRDAQPPKPGGDLFTAADAADIRALAAAIAAAFEPEPGVRRAPPQPTPEKPKLDPIAAALLADPQIGRLLGQLAHARDDLAPGWLEIDRDGPMPSVRIMHRGALVPGETVTRKLDKDTGRVVRVQERVSDRAAVSPEDLRIAASVAQRALERIGVQLRGFLPQVHRVKVPDFEGAVIAIGLAREQPPKLRVVGGLSATG